MKPGIVLRAYLSVPELPVVAILTWAVWGRGKVDAISKPRIESPCRSSVFLVDKLSWVLLDGGTVGSGRVRCEC